MARPLLVVGLLAVTVFAAQCPVSAGDEPSKPGISEEQARAIREQLRRLEEQIGELRKLLPPDPDDATTADNVDKPLDGSRVVTAGLRPRGGSPEPVRPASPVLFGGMTRPEGAKETRIVIPLPSLAAAGANGGTTVRKPEVYDGRTYHGALREGAGAGSLEANVESDVARAIAGAADPAGWAAMRRRSVFEAAIEAADSGAARGALAARRLEASPGGESKAPSALATDPSVRAAVGAAYAREVARAYASRVDDPYELAMGGAAGHAARVGSILRDREVEERVRAAWDADHRDPKRFGDTGLSYNARAALVRDFEASVPSGAVASFDVQASREEAFDRAYRTRLLAMEPHTSAGIHEVATFDERPRYFAATAGNLRVRSDAMRTKEGTKQEDDDCVDGKTPVGEKCVSADWGLLVAGEGKFSFVASSASNETLKKVQGARDHGLHKGFNADSLAVDHSVLLGGFLGHLRGKYFEDTVNGEKNVQLSNVYGELKDTGPDADILPAWVLRLGKSSIPISMNYNDDAWSYWMWGDRPLVYTRLFHGDLQSTGISALYRPIRERERHLYVRGGLFNGAETEMQGFIGGTGVGGYDSDGKGRYSLADLAYFADVGGAVDLRPCACDPLIFYGGAYALYGPNGTGDDGTTLVTGARARLVWMCGRTKSKEDRERDGFVLEGEWIRRSYGVDLADEPDPSDLVDWGAWVSGAWTWRDAFVHSGFMHCGAITLGARYDVLSGHGKSEDVPRQDDPDRTDRSRWSALLGIDPGDSNEFFRHFTFHVEYRYDLAPYDYDPKHTVYVGFQIR